MTGVEGENPPTGLLCCLLRDTTGVQIRDPHPSFGWVLGDQGQDDRQSAYRILLASTAANLDDDEGDLWDSGKVLSDNSTAVVYEGQCLPGNTRIFWKVQTWNQADVLSLWSIVESVETGELDSDAKAPRMALVCREVAPAVFIKKGSGHYFIDFQEAAFGTLNFRDVAGGDTSGNPVEVLLGEHISEPHSVWRLEDGGMAGGENVISHAQTMPWPDAASDSSSFSLDLKSRKSPGAAPLPAGVNGILPFRYCEIRNCPVELSQKNVVQQVVQYPFDDEAAHFESSNEILNDVWKLCKHSIKATTAFGVYVDGQRERIPYEADAYINQLGHYCCDREYSLARFSHEFLIHRPTWPTEWILFSVLMAWEDYLYTGDASSLARCYQDLCSKSLLALAGDNGLISLNNVSETKAFRDSIHFDGALKDIVDWPINERDGHEMVPFNTVVNAFHYRALVLMGRMAAALGKAEESDTFSVQAARVKKAFGALLFDSESGLFVDGIGSTHSSLHANMFPLAFGLVDAERVPSVVEFVKGRGMACSVYGAQFLLEALYRGGGADAALTLLCSTEERSWAHMTYDVGSSITLEAWDNKFKPNQDWNHAWGAAPANLIPRWLMGVRPLEPGFSKVLIAPQPGSLERAQLKTPTIRGPIELRLEQIVGKRLELELRLPANMSAEVRLPGSISTWKEVHLNGEKVEFQKSSGGQGVLSLGSGVYKIDAESQ